MDSLEEELFEETYAVGLKSETLSAWSDAVTVCPTVAFRSSFFRQHGK